MPRLHDLTRLGPDLAPLLEPGERPLTMETAAQAFAGEDRIGRAETSPSELTGWQKVALGTLGTGADLALGTGPRIVDANRVDRALGGLAGEGATGSAAWAVREAIGGAQRARLLVTDRRLLVLDEVGNGMRPDPDRPGKQRMASEYRVVFAAARPQLLAVRPAPALMQRGRLELRFTDGSMITVVTGALSRTPARRIIEALTG